MKKHFYIMLTMLTALTLSGCGVDVVQLYLLTQNPQVQQAMLQQGMSVPTAQVKHNANQPGVTLLKSKDINKRMQKLAVINNNNKKLINSIKNRYGAQAATACEVELTNMEQELLVLMHNTAGEEDFVKKADKVTVKYTDKINKILKNYN
ncbi:outer membrane lipopolysaccharide assembly protein LptE/RlpB [Elusimicrobium simillimum]|uniref:hypothetical protein n=1 Tax=Elusimicrobium simillimum TaxID=3143438 RepID=UPI003C6FA5C4